MVSLCMRDAILKGFFFTISFPEISRSVYKIEVDREGPSFQASMFARISQQHDQLRATGFSKLASMLEQSGRETSRDEVGFLKCRTLLYLSAFPL